METKAMSPAWRIVWALTPVKQNIEKMKSNAVFIRLRNIKMDIKMLKKLEGIITKLKLNYRKKQKQPDERLLL